MAAAERGEFALIARYFAPLARDAQAFSLTDDAALITPPAGQAVVVTKDMMVEGVHFPPLEAPGLIARKLLRVNLSDLAAMGAVAHGYALGLALPRETAQSWVAEFAAGLARDQDAFGVSLLGGDTVATPGPLTLSLTAFGFVAPDAALRRSGAQPGDALFVSGTIGDAALGLRLVGKGLAGERVGDDAAFLTERYRLPRPRLALGRALVGLASAALDISDGLIADIGHLARASGVQAVVMRDQTPLSDAARTLLAGDAALWPVILTGGDDYELAFSVPPGRAAQITRLARELSLPLTRIGHFEAGAGVMVLDGEGAPVDYGPGGYAHF
jgi:thiamine-monophosphate kinase